MNFNLNEFLIAISYALDFVEMDIMGVVTNHSKRVAYISMKMAEELGLSKEEIFDIVSLAILHDNGVSEKKLHDGLTHNQAENLHSIESMKEHGIKGEENIKNYPFITDVNNVIKYHHENYDGSGYFGLKGDDIPIMSQIIRLSDTIELNSYLKETNLEDKERIRAFARRFSGSMSSPELVDTFLAVSEHAYFWLDLKDEFISSSLKRGMPDSRKDLSLREIHNITKTFSKIIDSKSKFTQVHSRELSEKTAIMCDYYGKSEDEKYKLMIAADLHDIGKLSVSNSILDKPGGLDNHEVDIIKRHPYFTRLSLQEISGFEEITEWASNHHEKLDGSGYPFGKDAQKLDFNSRLIACLDIYQALTEERPYREPMTYERASNIITNSVERGLLDGEISRDILRVFKP